MSHLEETNLEINHIEAQYETIASSPRIQSRMLKMLYVIARLLARILDKMEETDADSN